MAQLIKSFFFLWWPPTQILTSLVSMCSHQSLRVELKKAVEKYVERFFL